MSVLRLPCVKGAPPKAVRDCFFLQPFHHFVVPLPLHRGGIKLCTNSPITEVSFAFLQAPSVQRLKNLYIVPDNRSFFCLLFFSKKSTGKEKYGQRKVWGNKRAGRGIPVRLICPAGDAGTGYWEMASIGLRDCRSSFLHSYFTPFTH